jgi:transposase
MGKRSFPPEFRAEAVRMVLEQQYSVSEACKALGVGDTALRRWIDQWKLEHASPPAKGKAMTPEQARIQELEKRVAQLERERELLKKSTAFFVKELDRSSK